MVLRCSLLGHDYGDPAVEREREERGSEVVVTVQEYEECARCGEKNVVSENTEVTSLTTGTDADPRPDEPNDDPDGTEPELIDGEAAVGGEAAADGEAAPDGNAIVDGEERTADSEPADPAAGDEEAEFDVPTDDNGDPVTDDGEILEDDVRDGDEGESDRAHGEWPDSDDVGQPTGDETASEGWPDEGNHEDDPHETEPSEDDAVILESDASPESATDAAGGDVEPTADGADGNQPDGETIDAEQTEASAGRSDTESGTGIERAAAAPTPTQGRAGHADAGATELYCPGCEYVAGTDRSSLRTGDICPECRKGYLSER